MNNVTAFEYNFSLPTPIFIGILIAAGLAVLLILFRLIVKSKPSDTQGRAVLTERLGLPNIPIPLFAIGVTLWSVVGIILLLGLLGLIFNVLTASGPDSDYLFYVLRIAGLTTVLAAVIALPFTLIRLNLTTQQTKTAEEALFNDKINAATQGLYARRQVSQFVDKGGPVDVWQDDIIQRNAAIDRLEGLAQEKPQEVPRIARLLSVYVRELSAEVEPMVPPADATPDDLRAWVRGLPALRSDMENAAQTLGRLANIAPEPLENGEIDLRGANLQRARLSGAQFNRSRLRGAHLQGADLGIAQLRFSDLADAKMQGTYLNTAQMHYASLSHAQLQVAEMGATELHNAHLVQAQLRQANLYATHLNGADLGKADMHGAYMVNAQLQQTGLTDTRVRGADLRGIQVDNATRLSGADATGSALQAVDLSGTPVPDTFLNAVFGDASVRLPNGARPGDPGWPPHWSTQTLDFDAFEAAWREWQATLPSGWDAPDD
ncbi:MAG: pentapeptide repeat-containing protein [Pseudomonadota bacterium]